MVVMMLEPSVNLVAYAFVCSQSFTFSLTDGRQRSATEDWETRRLMACSNINNSHRDRECSVLFRVPTHLENLENS